VVKSGNQYTYYFNGVPAGSATSATNVNILPFFIGGDPRGEQWQGRIDDAAIFSHSLT
jgi:hypothetical protein